MHAYRSRSKRGPLYRLTGRAKGKEPPQPNNESDRHQRSCDYGARRGSVHVGVRELTRCRRPQPVQRPRSR
eukprot:1100718-Rhodomonas_salina.2